MAQNREQLEKLLQFLDSLMKEPGNEWFVEELLKRVTNYNQSGILSNAKLDDIYEYCIELILKQQAEKFYETFPISEIKNQLVHDFVRMEHFRRKDMFEDFCMAMYQQIECICNKACSITPINEIAKKMMGYSPYVENNDFKQRKKSESNYSIAQLVFITNHIEKAKSHISEQYAIDKIRAVIYFICYWASMSSSSYLEFIENTNLINDLYQFRCLNHRGGVLTEYQQRIINDVTPKKYQYYLKLLGLLAFFVERFTKGYQFLPELKEYALRLEKKEVEIPTLKTIGKINLSDADLAKKRFK